MNEEQILILNDQGGAVMSVEYDVSPTLRAQDHGHPPVVLIYDARGNGDGGGYRQPSPETTKIESRTIRRYW